MNARKMVGMRKGAPGVTISIQGGGEGGKPAEPTVPQGPETAEGVVVCPECSCEFSTGEPPEQYAEAGAEAPDAPSNDLRAALAAKMGEQE